MTIAAREWFEELERLRNTAIMPPYYLQKKRFIGEEEEEYYVTDKDNRVICRMKLFATEPDNAAYIVAACNAVPRLVEMIHALADGSDHSLYGSCTKQDRIEKAYAYTEPKS